MTSRGQLSIRIVPSITYNAVNDTSMYNLTVSMEESYNSLSDNISSNLREYETPNTNTNGSAVKNAFKDSSIFHMKDLCRHYKTQLW